MPLPTHRWNPETGRYDAVQAQAMTVWAQTYVPNMVRWVEPQETTLVTVIADVPLAGGTGVLARYTRDTNFAGNLTEALKVMGFAK